MTSMSNKRSLSPWLAGLVGLVLGMAALHFWPADDAPPLAPDDAAAVSAVGEETVEGQPISAATQLPTLQAADGGVPLPPIDAPLRDVLAQLEQRAREGEAKAACRVAHERIACNSLPRVRLEYERWLAERRQGLELKTSGNYEVFIKNFEENDKRRRIANDRFANHCAEVDPAGPTEGVDLWRRAAMLGNPHAARIYAAGAVFRWDDILDATGQLVIWRAEAPQLAFSAAEQGDLHMTMILAGALTPFPTGSEAFLRQAMEADGPLALALLRRAHQALERVWTENQPEDPGEFVEDEYVIRAGSLESDVQRRIDELTYLLGPEGVRRADELEQIRFADWQPVTVPPEIVNMNSFGKTERALATECGKTEEMASAPPPANDGSH